MKLDVRLRIRDLREAAAAAQGYERLGYGTVWSSEVGHCPFMPLALAATATQRVGLGTAIAISFVRSPMVTASMAWDLQRASGGRLTLGLGTQVRAHNERRYSVPWTAPAPRVRELIRCIRAIWESFQTNAPAAFKGEHYQFTLMTPTNNPGPIDHPHIPIQLAGVNPIMCRTAGEVADGLQVHSFHSARYLREVVRPAAEEGRRRAGKTLDGFEFTSGLFVVTGQTKAEIEQADRAARDRIAYYASTPGYRRVFDTHGWGAVADELKLMVRRGEWERIAGKITDEMLAEFAVVAPPERLARAIQERCRGLLDRVALYLHVPPEDPDGRWRALLQGFGQAGAAA
ncbi:MAG: TIGR03617 family F420-dependent LLM class oxidoreductase [Candidatus Lambdaproteobacteria bacterium]|nr:TIGR03617 family F420-dependent LLM class oxidoreductase [Candidatus Lambdaproteobacteria bacterium]